MASASPEMMFWVNPYPFCFGVLQPHPKLSTVYLKKVLSYARSKAHEGGFPTLQWNIWKHMAVNKMLLDEDTAWMYFEIFISISELSRDERFAQAEMLQESLETGNVLNIRANYEVNTYQFVLFLYIQQSAKMSLRTSLVGEEWPGSSPRSRSPSPDLIEGTRSSTNIFDENSHRNFFLNNLTEILNLLSEPMITLNRSESCVSLEAVKALEFLVKGFVPKMKSLVALSSVVCRQRYQMNTGYAKETQTFKARVLEDWLRTNIGDNPFGLTACLTSGIKPKWTMSKAAGNSMKKARICSNGAVAPTPNKILFFTQCSNQTIARQTTLINDSYVKFHRSHNSYFYLLSPLRFVSIEKCQNSTFVLGPVSHCIRIVGCDNVTIIAPCRLLVVSLSRRIKTFTATPTRPLIIGDHVTGRDASLAVTMAPYHTYYAQLEAHLAEVGLVISPQTNQWNNPLCISHMSPSASIKSSNSFSPGLPRRRTDGSDLATGKSAVYFNVVKPSEFYVFNIPFHTDTSSLNSHASITSGIPWQLPHDYEAQVNRKKKKIDEYKRTLLSSNLNKEERKLFRARVETQFTKWLEVTGNKQQVDDLAELTKLYDKERKNAPS